MERSVEAYLAQRRMVDTLCEDKVSSNPPPELLTAHC